MHLKLCINYFQGQWYDAGPFAVTRAIDQYLNDSKQVPGHYKDITITNVEINQPVFSWDLKLLLFRENFTKDRKKVSGVC